MLPLIAILAVTLTAADTQTPADEANRARTERHRSNEWLLVEPHLPDPLTASPETLTVAADVLRARRLPEDALDYYKFAITRGGEPSTLFNRIGITLLELHQPLIARAAFRRALQIRPKEAQTWNNLGASEYVSGNVLASIADYQKAVKMDKKGAVYHANLGTAYFDVKNVEDARRQFALAIKLDKDVFQRGEWGGVQAHVLSPADRGLFCVEMARLAARQHDDEAVLRWLGKASESGYDIRQSLLTQREFDSYRKDPRIEAILHNIRAMKPGQLAQSAPVPSLSTSPAVGK